MINVVRRGLLLACLVGLFCMSGCREEEAVPSTEPNMNSQGAGGTDS